MARRNKDHSENNPRPDAAQPVIVSSSDIGLEVLPDWVVRAVTALPDGAWMRCRVQDGSADLIRFLELEGVHFLHYVRGADGRCLLGIPLYRGTEPSLDQLLAACREILERVDIIEASALGPGLPGCADPSTAARSGVNRATSRLSGTVGGRDDDK